jgi:ABC-2 type transport system ATP-binding protein
MMATQPAQETTAAAKVSPKPIISVRDLHRTFGNVHAVRGVTFDIFPAQVVGFIGANGAGKTTTMRMMATLDVPSSGSIEVGGCDVMNFPREVRRKIGWMPDNYGTYDQMTVFEYLDFFGRAFGFKHDERANRVRDVMDFTDLMTIAERPMNKLSKGMGQRLCLGRTLLHDPEVLILDEPAAGLDPKARIEFKRLVRLLADDGKTIFISSHILSELGEMCDTLLFIDAGRIVHHGSAESLQEQQSSAQTLINVQVAGDPAALAQWISLNPGVKLAESRKRGARIALESDAPELLAATLSKMIADGIPVTDFHREERRLEDAFVDMLKKVGGGAAEASSSGSEPPPLPK